MTHLNHRYRHTTVFKDLRSVVKGSGVSESLTNEGLQEIGKGLHKGISRFTIKKKHILPERAHMMCQNSIKEQNKATLKIKCVSGNGSENFR